MKEQKTMAERLKSTIDFFDKSHSNYGALKIIANTIIDYCAVTGSNDALKILMDGRKTGDDPDKCFLELAIEHDNTAVVEVLA